MVQYVQHLVRVIQKVRGWGAAMGDARSLFTSDATSGSGLHSHFPLWVEHFSWFLMTNTSSSDLHLKVMSSELSF